MSVQSSTQNGGTLRQRLKSQYKIIYNLYNQERVLIGISMILSSKSGDLHSMLPPFSVLGFLNFLSSRRCKDSLYQSLCMFNFVYCCKGKLVHLLHMPGSRNFQKYFKFPFPSCSLLLLVLTLECILSIVTTISFLEHMS